MTAPSLVLLSHGSVNPAVSRVSHELRTQLHAVRPALDIQVAFLDHGQPQGLQLVNKLVKRGVTEVVFVPLLLSDVFQPHAEVPAVMAQIRAGHPELKATASRPIGPESHLLSVVDRRLRGALRDRRASELDALVFASLGSADVRSNAIVARRARQWSHHHKLPCVTSFATHSHPSAAEAVRTLRGQGRRHIAVGSWFLDAGDIYLRERERAYGAGAVAVSSPLGSEPEIVNAILARYVVAAMDLVDVEVDSTDFEPLPARHLSVVSA